MPVFDTSRATRLTEKVFGDLKHKREWAAKNQEPPFGMAKADMESVVKAYREARSPEQRRQLIEANGAEYMLKALRQHSALPGLEDEDNGPSR